MLFENTVDAGLENRHNIYVTKVCSLYFSLFLYFFFSFPFFICCVKQRNLKCETPRSFAIFQISDKIKLQTFSYEMKMYIDRDNLTL